MTIIVNLFIESVTKQSIALIKMPKYHMVTPIPTTIYTYKTLHIQTLVGRKLIAMIVVYFLWFSFVCSQLLCGIGRELQCQSMGNDLEDGIV